jgi:hypothetical protein
MQHIQTNQEFLKLCQQFNIMLNPKKCELHKHQIEFLGVELSEQGFEMEQGKVQAICEWKVPTMVRGI